MKVYVAALAEHVNLSLDGTINASGIFHQIIWSEERTMVPQMYAAIVLMAEEQDYDTDQSIRVALLDPQKEPLVEAATFDIRVPPKPPQGRHAVNLVTQWVNTLLTGVGTYQVVIYQGDASILSFDLDVVEH